MDSEDVTIRLLENSYTVDALFHFFNTGETTTELVGFPKRGSGTEFSFRTEEFIRFETWVNDKEVQFTEEPEPFFGIWQFLRRIFADRVEDYRWLVKQVPFPGHATTTTRVSYEAPYHKTDGLCAFYIYGTGSYWKDSIGKATFTINGGDVIEAKHLLVSWEPPDLEITRTQTSVNTLIYELADFKPAPDSVLQVCFTSTFVKRPPYN
jgi:hypothetical protein